MVTALHNRENCGTGFSRKLQLVLVVNLASGVFGLFIFHRFEDWTAQHQADKLPKNNLKYTTDYLGCWPPEFGLRCAWSEKKHSKIHDEILSTENTLKTLV